MFDSWSIRKVLYLFLSLIFCVGIIQVFMFLYTQSINIHFILSFLALFFTLMLVHTVNIKLKQRKKSK